VFLFFSECPFSVTSLLGKMSGPLYHSILLRLILIEIDRGGGGTYSRRRYSSGHTVVEQWPFVISVDSSACWSDDC